MKTMSSAVIGAAFLSACAGVGPARMALDTALANVRPWAFEGAGFGRNGAFKVADWHVTFERSESRLAVFDPLYERRSGTLRFTIDGPDLDRPIDADCSAREATVSLGLFSKDVSPMAFGCQFTVERRSIPARLELQAASPNALLPMHERRGEIALDRVILSIRSVHAWEGSPIRNSLPVGYEFRRDGVLIGAVELNGTPILRLVPGAELDERRAAVVAAVATGLLWDPSASSLGR